MQRTQAITTSVVARMQKNNSNNINSKKKHSPQATDTNDTTWTDAAACYRQEKLFKRQKLNSSTQGLRTITIVDDNDNNEVVPEKQQLLPPPQPRSQPRDSTNNVIPQEVQQYFKRSMSTPRITPTSSLSSTVNNRTRSLRFSKSLDIPRKRPACVTLPEKIWHQILDFLPTSHVPTVALVSKTLLQVIHSWSRWQWIYSKMSLSPSLCRRYRSSMSLVCSESCYLCDLCDSRTTGTGAQFSPEEIPMPVQTKHEAEGRLWRLCWDCRCDYYKRNPEKLTMLNPFEVVTGTWVLQNIKLKVEDLSEIDSFVGDKQSLKRFYGLQDWELLDEDRILYNKAHAIQVAVNKFGGSPGLRAVVMKAAKRVEREYWLKKKW